MSAPACRYCLGIMEPDTWWQGKILQYYFVCSGCRSTTPHGSSRESATFLANHPAPTQRLEDFDKLAPSEMPNSSLPAREWWIIWTDLAQRGSAFPTKELCEDAVRFQAGAFKRKAQCIHVRETHPGSSPGGEG